MKAPVIKFLSHWTLMGALCAFALSACGDNKSEAPVVENAPSVQAEALSENPEPLKLKVGAEIKETYQWYCAQCHGMKGKGDGINAKMTTVLPRDHTKAAYLEGRTDDQLFHAIKLGGLAVGRAPCMPAWGHTLEEETIHGLVNYIRELCDCEGPA